VRTLIQLICLLLVLRGGTRCGAQKLYSDLEDQRYWFRTIIVPEDELDVPKLEQAVRGFMTTADRRSVVVLSMFTDGQDAAMSAAAARDSYREWRVYYEKASARPLRTAQAIAIGGDWVLRVRLADGRVDKRILAGRDPLRFESGGAVFHILAIQPRAATGFDPCDSETSLSPVVYLETDAALTSSLCQTATGRLARLLGTTKLLASFRNDHWFVSFGGFPVVYPFSVKQAPPSEAAYYNSYAFTCRLSCGQKADCIQTLGPGLALPRHLSKE